MKSMKRATFIGILLTLVLTGSAVFSETDFDPVFEWVEKLRDSDEVELKAIIELDSIVFLQSNKATTANGELDRLTTPGYRKGSRGFAVRQIQDRLIGLGYEVGAIDGVYGEKTRESVEKWQRIQGMQATGEVDSTAWVKLISGVEFPFRIEYGAKIGRDGVLTLTANVDRELRLEETYKGNKAIGSHRIDFLRIGAYALDEWPSFLTQAIQHGLRHYRVISGADWMLLLLDFEPTAPPTLMFGTKRVTIGKDFCRSCRMSPEHRQRASTGDKFVLIFHEPHWSTPGQFQLVRGLTSLQQQNPQHQYAYLVEGDFDKSIATIPTAPTMGILLDDVPVATQVQSMLNDFLIDGPFAFRLLNDPGSPGLAIDDTTALRSTPSPPELKGAYDLRELIVSAIEELASYSSETRANAEDALTTLWWYLNADASELEGPDLLQYNESVEELFEDASRGLRSVSLTEFRGACRELDAEAEYRGNYCTVLRHALARDTVMARNINEFASRYDRVPLIFIGSFHTPGILELLSPNLGYAVFETHCREAISDRQRIKYNQNLFLENQGKALEGLLSRIKRPVAPHARLLPSYGRYLNSNVRQKQRRREEALLPGGFGKKTSARITDAFEKNGELCTADIQIGWTGDGVTPPPIDGVFAALRFDPEGGDPQFIMFDSREENWKRDDRLSFLTTIAFAPQAKIREGESHKVTFYVDDITKRVFSSYFESKTGTFFLIEAENAGDIAGVISKFRELTPEEIRIKMRLSLLEQMDGHVEPAAIG